jgi:hypothetical protein
MENVITTGGPVGIGHEVAVIRKTPDPFLVMGDAENTNGLDAVMADELVDAT